MAKQIVLCLIIILSFRAAGAQTPNVSPSPTPYLNQFPGIIPGIDPYLYNNQQQMQFQLQNQQQQILDQNQILLQIQQEQLLQRQRELQFQQQQQQQQEQQNWQLGY